MLVPILLTNSSAHDNSRVGAIRCRTGQRLPVYMVPCALMLLESLSLTANGALAQHVERSIFTLWQADGIGGQGDFEEGVL